MPERPVTISGIRIIALAAVILGRWSVPGAHAAALFLGDFDALQSKQQLSHPDVPNWPTGDHLAAAKPMRWFAVEREWAYGFL